MQIRTIQGTVALGLLVAGFLAMPVFAQEKKKELKDPGEGEIVGAIQKETNPQKKLQLLEQWKEKYPTSDFKVERAAATLATAQQANDGPKARAAARDLATDATGMAALQAKSILVQFGLADKNDAGSAEAERNAQSILESLEKDMAADKKPAEVTADQWSTQKKAFEAFALKSLGDAPFAKKDFVKAEQEYAKALKTNPNNATISQLLATSIVSQRKAERQPIAMWHYARSAVLSGEGALPEAAKKQTLAFVEKNYVSFHGSRDGLDDILNRAKTEAFPPEGFTIESKAALEAKNREELMKTNPMLGKWYNLKDLLTAPDGEAKFASDIKDSNAGGPYKGKLISATPETKPKELVLSISDGLTPEVTLKFETALPGKAEAGTELEFDGSAIAFAKEPFNITFDADSDKLVGWPVKPAPAGKKAAPTGKKAAPKK